MFRDKNLDAMIDRIKEMKMQLVDLKAKFGEKSAWVRAEEKAIIDLQSQISRYSGQIKNLPIPEKMELFENIASSVGRAFSAVQTVIGAVISLGQEIYELSLAGADFNTVRDGFYNLSGSIEKAENDLAIFRKAASFNLNDKDLMSYANKMYTLGFNSEQTAQMLDIVEESGDRVGLTFTEANDSLNAFLTSGKTTGLEQLKIPVSEVEKEVQKLTGSLGKNKDQLSDLEKQQINTTALLNVYGRSMDDISSKQLEGSDNILLMKTSIENLQNGFQSFIADALSPVIAIGSEFVAEYQKMIAEIFGGKDAVDNLKQGFVDLVKNAFQYWLDQWRAHYKPALVELLSTLKRIIDENPELIEGIKMFAELLITTATRISGNFVSALNEVLKYLEKIKEGFDAVKTLGQKIHSFIGPAGMKGRAGDDEPIINYDNAIKASNRSFDKKKEEATVEFYKENLNLAVSSAQQIASTLGIGAHTFVGTLLNGLSSAMSLASSVASLISSVANLASGGGFFSVIGKIFGFAEGGRVPGTGSGDTVPAMLTPGEFVIRKSIVDKMGSSFFAWINGGLLPSMAGHHAMGGMVSPVPSPVVNNSFDVHIDRRGDVHVVKKALQKIKSNNKYFGG